jgi:hypothetical protein
MNRGSCAIALFGTIVQDEQSIGVTKKLFKRLFFIERLGQFMYSFVLIYLVENGLCSVGREGMV